MDRLLDAANLGSKPASADYFPSVRLAKEAGFVNRQGLFNNLMTTLSPLAINPDVIFGVNSYLHKTFTDEYFNLSMVARSIAELQGITSGQNFYKSRSFNYLPGSGDIATVLSQSLENARLMVALFGVDFFGKKPHDPRKRKTFYKGVIQDSGFHLTAKAGSGASTFSVDFALGVERGQGYANSGELWRSGFDTEILPNGGLGVRIIRTGTGVRHDPIKTAKFDEFKGMFKTTPARVLTGIVIGCAARLLPDRVTALTTDGARDLSSLPKGPNAYNYTGLYRGLGFKTQVNGFWLELDHPPEPSKKEKEGWDRIIKTACSLKDDSSAPFLLAA